MAEANTEWVAVDGAHLSKDETRIAGTIIDRMRSRGVCVTAEAFFAECQRDRDGRRLFNPNKAQVLREAYLERARYILRSVTVRVTRVDSNDRKVTTTLRRGFVPVTDKVAGRDGSSPSIVTHYVGLTEVMANPVLRKQFLARALAEANNWVQRYEELKECGRIVRAVAKTRADVRL